MPFPQSVRDQVLVAAARHCCVCHRYKGVKVEVHHIIQESKGGANDIENAIALCFDCHCDAGHYNDRHPRGTKFSPGELRAARNAWYGIVSRASISPPEEKDILYCRYLVCRDVQAFREIVSGDLSKLPFENVMVAENSVLSFQRKLLQAYSGFTRRTVQHAQSYRDIESCLQAFPDAVRVDRSSTAFGFYETLRIPSLVELAKLGKSDAFTSLLLEAGVPSSEIALAIGHTVEPACGGAPDELNIDRSSNPPTEWFEEEYSIRPVWGIFLIVTNESNEKICLNSILGHSEPVSSLCYRRFTAIGGEKGHSPLPRMRLSIGQTILIPVGTVLAPIESIPCQSGAKETQWLEGGEGYYQELCHSGYQSDQASLFHLIGPVIRPSGISLQTPDRDMVQEIHELDLNNLYMLDRNFAIGSCPHLFFLMNNGSCTYAGELFRGRPESMSRVDFHVPAGSEAVLVAELLKERTYFESIYNGSDLLVQDKWIKENEVLVIPGMAGKVLTLRGYYILEQTSTKAAPSTWFLNETVCRFMAHLTAYKEGLTGEELPSSSKVIPPFLH